MKDKLKKINLDQIKEVLFNHGEKIALGVCAFLALLFGSMGLLSAMNAGRDDKGNYLLAELKKKSDAIGQGINAAANQPLDEVAKKDLEETKKRLNPDGYIWVPHEPTLPWHPMTGVSEGETSTKRDNPILLGFNPGTTIQLDYIQAPIFLHEYQAASDIIPKATVTGLRGAEGAGPPGVGKVGVGPGAMDGGALAPFVRVAKPYRMVVGTLAFPMKQQVAEFCTKLRMKSQKELYDSRDDWPTPLGINVVRFELMPDGKWSEPRPVVLYDPNKKTIELSKQLKDLMRVAMFDEFVAEKLEPYAFDGLLMPMPKLAHIKCPPINLITKNEKGKIESKIEVDFDEEKDPAKKEKAKKDPMKDPGPMTKIGGREPKKTGPMPNPKDKQPMGNQAPPNALPTVPLTLNDFQKSGTPPMLALAGRLFEDDYNIYHILGWKATGAEEPKKGPAGVQPPMQGGQQGGAVDRYFSAFTTWGETGTDGKTSGGGGRPMVSGTKPMTGKSMPGTQPMPGGDNGAQLPVWDRDAVVRFVDPQVEEGKIYRYAVQVRMKNPNFGKADLVKYNALAAEEELKPSPLDPNRGWITTQEIKIAPEYHLYCVDQQLLDSAEKESGIKAPAYELKKAQDYTALQIHKWVEGHSHALIPYVVGDWVVAERQLVRKGDIIGNNIEVKFVSWNKQKDMWEVPHKIPGANKTLPNKPGFVMDLRPSGKEMGDRPMLIDFYGGKKKDGKVEEDSPVDALILAPDGRLVVYNSRVDSESVDRKVRVIHARERIKEALPLSESN